MLPFGPFERQPLVAVGVSGGRDSLSLVLLANEWAAAREGRALALIVDHGLRAEAAAEAASTAKLLARHGIETEILPWSGPKPATGLQEAARVARYRLLFGACRQRGILHLLVAHQADDQAETVAMRAARGSGSDGLAGMAAVVEYREGRLLRPLLSVPRSRLTATLVERGVRWIDDPSNSDPRFERARLRQGAPQAPVDPELATLRMERERRLAEIALDTLVLGPSAVVSVDQTAFSALERQEGVRLLGRVVQAVGGREYPTRRERLERAAMRLSEAVTGGRSGGGKSGKSQDFTLSRCRLALRRDPAELRLRWIVRPESGRNDMQTTGKPLIPAVFFACGAQDRPHLDMKLQ
ncbi:tRNA(Ile)-lysidine synthase [Enhydrobacter aerosaccus]|uniref:tRNA(Ile)-lysidine synthase n=1 Tax=Enhydrobacter aerosaccus TaxID=225324 RepID=A0A1T4K652_9HYPH|nr:tRNA lysidine(34) synthetase TilS [Enhydrobacter aerosaccus]SJZ37807.1 tRNA(Ile)-lysidine synthase [Enhydrobacter aerosaccus]